MKNRAEGVEPQNRRAWVIYQLSLKGTSLAALARELGVRPTTIYQAFDRPYPRMEQAIAEAVGITPQELFPERYREDGSYFRKGVRNG